MGVQITAWVKWGEDKVAKVGQEFFGGRKGVGFGEA